MSTYVAVPWLTRLRLSIGVVAANPPLSRVQEWGWGIGVGTFSLWGIERCRGVASRARLVRFRARQATPLQNLPTPMGVGG